MGSNDANQAEERECVRKAGWLKHTGSEAEVESSLPSARIKSPIKGRFWSSRGVEALPVTGAPKTRRQPRQHALEHGPVLRS